MAFGDAYLAKADALVVELFAGWNSLTTVIAAVIVLYVAYPWFTWREPDTHPLLLARQATASPVRNKGESSVYRSLEVPYGYPLRSGLNVKDPGALKWTSGRDGDLRDVWKRAIQGPPNDDGTPPIQTGKLLTVLGKEQVLSHELDGISQEINIIGQHIKQAGGSTVAIYLSNSPELLASVFAAAFYGFRAILVPYKLDMDDLIKHLSLIKPDVLIAEAGTVDLGAISKSCSDLSQIIWVAKYGSRHMDWNEVPEGVGGKLDVAVWHELFDVKKGVVGSELPASEQDSSVAPLGVFSSSPSGPRVIDYPSQSLVAAIAAQVSSLPRAQRFSLEDIVLPSDSLSSIYPLTVVLAALYSGSTIALNSVAGQGVDLRSTATGVSPTVIVASSTSLTDYHEKKMSARSGFFEKLSHSIQSQSLDVGSMPTSTSLSKLTAGGTAAVEPALKHLRLIIASLDVSSNASPISSQALADLRVATGARIVYALTAPEVAGAITQSHVFDYRRFKGSNHFGTPVSSVEVKLVGDEADMSKDNPTGKISVSGPAVVGGTTVVEGIKATINDDATLSLA